MNPKSSNAIAQRMDETIHKIVSKSPWLKISKNGDTINVGDYRISVAEGQHSVLSPEGNLIHEGLYLVESAILIVEMIYRKKPMKVRNILEIDRKYGKYSNDLACFKYMIRESVSSDMAVILDRMEECRYKRSVLKNELRQTSGYRNPQF